MEIKVPFQKKNDKIIPFYCGAVNISPAVQGESKEKPMYVLEFFPEK